jgi:hypothetical protein
MSGAQPLWIIAQYSTTIDGDRSGLAPANRLPTLATAAWAIFNYDDWVASGQVVADFIEFRFCWVEFVMRKSKLDALDRAA